ncbi:predicted protein [Nematostella vectensis]|uniref:CN hydrolase domain-containing protein n=1 Tax=Nematostella vectensis TaxID=45351 RepID=A7SL86_NEMVE|nr:predicted protein [Nematostella vectensis]|eukprot:XP_001627628.1 predicted protein [Nematostella vectensis]
MFRWFVAKFSLLALVIISHIKSVPESEFIAAVYEHVPPLNRPKEITRANALGIMMRNIDTYEEQMVIARDKNSSIIVFPEYGLTGWNQTRSVFKHFLENIPDPKISSNPCLDPGINKTTPILYRLSCLARKYAMYLVVNMGDIKPCQKASDPHCPGDGRYQYNTNVVFSDNGTLVARYHKQHPFMNEMKVVNRPRVPELVTFQTPFGKFGTFVCFDVLFQAPAVQLVTSVGIDHVVFPTAWFDVLPLFPAIGFHSSWARGIGVNFLAANTHVPSFANTGSGIYSSSGAREYYRSFSASGKLLIASLPKSPKKSPSNMTYVKTPGNTNDDVFYSDLFGDQFLFKELDKAEAIIRVCYPGSKSCCTLHYKMAAKLPDELYALGVFDGLHTLEGQYYLRVCTLIKCFGMSRSSCGSQVSSASTIFDSFALRAELNASHVFPAVVAHGVTLLRDEWDHDVPVKQVESKRRLSKGLLSATLFGRVYSLDGGKTSSTGRATCGPTFILTLRIVCIAMISVNLT